LNVIGEGFRKMFNRHPETIQKQGSGTLVPILIATNQQYTCLAGRRATQLVETRFDPSQERLKRY
jgi:hypothetical protein